MAKIFEINISSNAQKDLEHIFYYIAEDSINKAKKFVLELEKKVYDLETMPERYALIPENIYYGTEYRHLTHKIYRIIYKITHKSVFILRIIHGAKMLDL